MGKRVKLFPPSPDDGDVASRHQTMILLKERPELWPELNRLTVGEAAADWTAVLEYLRQI